MDMKWYYDNCKDFKEYVDKLANCRHLSTVDVMQFVITKEYLKMLIAEGRTEKC